MKTINLYEIRIDQFGVTTRNDLTAFNIALESEDQIVLEEKSGFAILDKTKRKHAIHSAVDHISISIHRTEFDIRIFGAIWIRCYSTKTRKITENRIKKAFKSRVAKEFGFLRNISSGIIIKLPEESNQ
jgi:hypothetical protein